jgi:putative oxidoreductase
MQRLFSTFPNAWPGCGLLLLRLAGGLPLLFGTTGTFVVGSNPEALALRALVHGIGALLIIGVCTPVAATLQMIVEACIAISGGTIDQGHIVSGIIGLSLTMLGPGAWSVDARLFGRKRINVNTTTPP